MKTSRRNVLCFILLTLNLVAITANCEDVIVAVLDRGIDVEDPRLREKISLNRDNDLAGPLKLNKYSGDVWGWNAVNESPRIYTPRADKPEKISQYLKFNDLQQIQYIRPWTEREKADVMDQMSSIDLDDFNEFLGHTHGQHVAGLVLKDTKNTKLIPVTIVADASDRETQIELSADFLAKEDVVGLDIPSHFLALMPEKYYQLNEVRRPLFILAGHYLKQFLQGMDYIKTRNAKLVNMSFDSSARDALTRVVADAWFYHFRSVPQPAVWTSYVQETQRYMSSFFEQRLLDNSDKLFIMASGNWRHAHSKLANDGDVDPTFPGSVAAYYKPSNILIVAATNGRGDLASFSGFGAKTVHLAAPGVGVASYIVGGGTYQVSGTSQATPYVTNTAAKMLETNAHLSVTQIRRILMETVDKKEFLKEKIVSGGIVNPPRAIRTAELILAKIPIDAAIVQAHREVRDL